MIDGAPRAPRWFAGLMLASSAGFVLACSNDTTRPGGGRVQNFALTANATNVLAANATFDVAGADSARIIYASNGVAPRGTPFTTAVTGARIPVLGLRPSTTYQMHVEARSGGSVITSAVSTFATGDLPTYLQRSHMDSDHPSSGGYILTGIGDATTAYAVAFDSTGAVAWYRGFAEGVPAGEIKQQTNGDITMFLGSTHGGEAVPGRYVEISPDGGIVRTIAAATPSFTDNHELLLLMKDGAYDGAAYFTYTQRHLDLSAHGAPSDTVVTGHQLVRLQANGSQATVFDAWDHYSVDDNVEPVTGEPDFDHPNALAIAPDGHYVISWRNFDAITKVDATTGAIHWTLAAPGSVLHSDFVIGADPLSGFNAQHSVKVLDDGHILVFDNGTKHEPPVSRGVEYVLDSAAHTAQLVWSYTHAPPILTAFTGSVQRLANGNTLLGWTVNDPLEATEVTSDGTVVWEGLLNTPGSFPPYRFTKIAALEHYRRP